MLPVLISIRSSAYREDSPETESMQILVPGTMTLSDDGHVATLQYEETVDHDVPPQQVSVIVTDDSVSVNRVGAYSSLLFFKQGNSYQTTYYMPMGEMALSVYCTYLKIDLDETGGTLCIRYQMDMNGQFVAMHETEMTVAPTENARPLS